MDDTSWVDSLAKYGVPVPASFSSLRDFTPKILFSVCSHALRLIHGTASFPADLAEDCPTPDRERLCTDLASAFNELGFFPKVDFRKFLYPTDEDAYMMVRFLVEKLSGSHYARSAASVDHDKIRISPIEKCSEVGETVHNEELSLGSNGPMLKDHGTEQASSNEKDNYEFLGKQKSERVPNLQHVDEELGLLRAAVEMISDGQHPIEFCIEQLYNEVEAKRHKVKELGTEWKGKIESLQEKKKILEQSLTESRPDVLEKLVRKKEIELEAESVLAEIKMRDEEISRLSSDLKNQTEHTSRKSYIERIKEITKNSRKLDTDIQRILKDTRELQLESNSTQERLNRTYAVIDETIFREAKKDSVARQAYRLLTKIHESFEQIAENILATDRTRRDASDFEAKVAAMSSRGLDLGKIQAKGKDPVEERLHNA